MSGIFKSRIVARIEPSVTAIAIRDRRQLEKLIDAAAAFLVAAFQLDAHARAALVIFRMQKSAGVMFG